ncbi:hypothetical protein DXG01_002901 [Tephrocybe rancida]|nr:hypothetical protein DXG01_002901 [Tephrocybe rancida]
MEASISTSASSASTLRSLSQTFPAHNDPSSSEPSSPRSSNLQSPPDSPSSDSVSSLPSVSSSFFFSSAAASPPHPQPELRDSTNGLVIPSLTLPTALRRPTPYGQTLGDLRLLVLGSKGVGKSFVSGLLLEENEDVVEVGAWEGSEDGRVIHASTDWIEHRDAHGLEKFEPTRNVEIVEFPGYDSTTNSHSADTISTPAPTVLDNLLLDALGPQMPIIVLPRFTIAPPHARISSFRPSSAVALRAGLFHSPETIAVLRSEATDRFLRWREVERSVDDIHTSQRDDTAHLYHYRDPDGLPWSKAKWEAEWISSLSQDVARRLREGTITERSARRRPRHYEHVRFDDASRPCVNSTPYDPLHLPSLVMFSLSLLGPLRARMRRTFARIVDVAGDKAVRVALLSGFCAGVGVGLFLTSSGSR